MVSAYKITSHHVQDIRTFKKLTKTLDGVDRKLFKKMSDQIEEASGTPQEPMNWKEPKRWISALLYDGVFDEETKALAERLWSEELNPRHYNYPYARPAVRHGFLTDKGDKYSLTEEGKSFVNGDEKVIDKYLWENGIFKILEVLKENTGAKTNELIEAWRDWINKEGGRNVKALNVLKEGVFSRIDNVLIPLGYVTKEGIPRRYFITEKGIKKIERIEVESKERGKQEKTIHDIAIKNILDIGGRLGYQIQAHPKLRDLLPKEKATNIKERVYDKELDGLWKTNLPIVGEIRIPIEVQSHGSITDLLFRLKAIAPFSHFMIVVSDEKQIEQIDEYIKVQGDEKTFSDKIIYITFEELTEIRGQVSNISSKLKPSYGVGEELPQEEED